MNKNVTDFIAQLPEACRHLAIAPRHKTLLASIRDGRTMWVVLLTEMPGDSCKAWRMGIGTFWSLRPKYGSRERYIREHYPPVMEGTRNEPKTQDGQLFQ